jgi:hypothetical protein
LPLSGWSLVSLLTREARLAIAKNSMVNFACAGRGPASAGVLTYYAVVVTTALAKLALEAH